MTSAERTEVLVTARLLQATAKFQWLSIGLTLLALVSLVLEKSGSLVLVAVAGLGLVVNYYGFRMAFDARLLTNAAAERLIVADLDVAFSPLAGEAGKGGAELVRALSRLKAPRDSLWNGAGCTTDRGGHLRADTVTSLLPAMAESARRERVRGEGPGMRQPSAVARVRPEPL